MAEKIIYPKGVVPRKEDFREAQKMRGEVYKFLKETMEETAESAFESMGYTQKSVPAGFYADGNAYGFGVGEGVYNVKVGSKTDSYLEKRLSLGSKRIVVEMHMTIFPDSKTVEMHYKNTEDAAFRGFKETEDGYMINEKIIISCADMDKFKEQMTKKLKEFSKKEVGYITTTKLGNDDRMEKSTASIVEGLTLSSLFSDDFNTTSDKIMEMTKSDKDDEDNEECGSNDLLLGDEVECDKEKTDEITTSGGGAGSAGAFAYDAPFGAPRKRTMKTSAPFTEPVNESVESNTKIVHPRVEVEPGIYDESEINIYTIIDAKGKVFGPYERAIEWLVDQMKSDESLDSFLRLNLSTKDDLIVGEHSFAGIDIMDFMESMNESKNIQNTAYGRRLKENRRPSNHTRIIPEGKDGFWTVVPQETLDAYKSNHIMGAPGAEGVEVNSKEEEELNSGGYHKFPGGKSHKYKMQESSNSLEDDDVLRNRQKHWAKTYVQEAESPIVAKKLPHSDTLVILEGANPENPNIESQGYKLMKKETVLDLIENKGFHAILNAYHKLNQESVDPSVSKRWKKVEVSTQTELNERWKKLATMNTNESIRMAESVIPDKEISTPKKRPLTESVTGLEKLSRNSGLEEGEVIDGKTVIEVEKPNCLAPVLYKVFKEHYENSSRAFIWDFNTGTLVNNPGFKS